MCVKWKRLVVGSFYDWVCIMLIFDIYHWHVMQYGNILAGPQLSVSNTEPVSSAKTSVTVSATGSATASSTPTFSIKIMSEKKKSEYSVQNLHISGQFSSLDALKQVVATFQVCRPNIDTGWIWLH